MLESFQLSEICAPGVDGSLAEVSACGAGVGVADSGADRLIRGSAGRSGRRLAIETDGALSNGVDGRAVGWAGWSCGGSSSRGSWLCASRVSICEKFSSSPGFGTKRIIFALHLKVGAQRQGHR